MVFDRPKSYTQRTKENTAQNAPINRGKIRRPKRLREAHFQAISTG